jgi:hypothetical protein
VLDARVGGLDAVALEFPRAARAKEWWSSELYRPIKAIRHATATSGYGAGRGDGLIGIVRHAGVRLHMHRRAIRVWSAVGLVLIGLIATVCFSITRSGRDPVPAESETYAARAAGAVPVLAATSARREESVGTLGPAAEQPTSGAMAELRACCGSDDGTSAACAARLDLLSATAEALAEWLCDTSCGKQTRFAAIQGASIGRAPADLFAFLDRLQSECSRFRETPILPAILARAEETHPGWLASVQQHVTPEVVFGAESEALVQLMEYFVERDDPYVEALLRDGARGYFGGSDEQVFRAGLIVAVHAAGGAETVDFMESLMDSSHLPPDARMGCLLVQFLATEKARIDGSAERAMQTIRAALSDPRLARDAANQLVKYFDPHAPPGGFDPEAWAELMAAADSLADVH